MLLKNEARSDAKEERAVREMRQSSENPAKEENQGRVLHFSRTAAAASHPFQKFRQITTNQLETNR